MIVLPIGVRCGATTGGDGALTLADAGGAVGADPIGRALSGGAIIGAPYIGGPGGAAIAGALGAVAVSPDPQLRQNFIPGGFSPRHTAHIVGNPPLTAGVCATAVVSELPQLRQNDDPGGLSWPQTEQRI